MGANISKRNFRGKPTWQISSKQYASEAINNIEKKLGKKLDRKRITTPLEVGYHPKLDTSELLDDEEASYYQSLVGIGLWLVELGRVDLAQPIGLMSRYSYAPRQGHMEAMVR